MSIWDDIRAAAGGQMAKAAQWMAETDEDVSPDVAVVGDEVPGLGKEGDDEFYWEGGPIGRYRSRQYEVSITDNVPLTLVSIEENVLGGEDA